MIIRIQSSILFCTKNWLIYNSMSNLNGLQQIYFLFFLAWMIYNSKLFTFTEMRRWNTILRYMTEFLEYSCIVPIDETNWKCCLFYNKIYFIYFIATFAWEVYTICSKSVQELENLWHFSFRICTYSICLWEL